jgi:toxin ParE1/3/4
MLLIFTPAAERDLDDIWFAVAPDSPRNADRMIDRIRERAEQLPGFPESGPSRPDIAIEARSLNVGNYLLLYRIEAAEVIIIRVVHGARDLTDLL